MLRLFFALLPGPEQATGLVAQVAPLLTRLVAQPVPAANLHATLCFVGAVPAERLGELCAAAARVHAPTVSLEFGALDLWAKPKILCATVTNDASCAAGRTLAQRLEKEVIDAGFTPDGKPFRPHLTLARKVSLPRDKDGWPRELAPPFRLHCDRFVLMRSDRGDAGSIYSVVAEWPLDTAADADKSR